MRNAQNVVSGLVRQAVELLSETMVEDGENRNRGTDTSRTDVFCCAAPRHLLTVNSLFVCRMNGVDGFGETGRKRGSGRCRIGGERER